jgi:hypothetical protein
MHVRDGSERVSEWCSRAFIHSFIHSFIHCIGENSSVVRVLTSAGGWLFQQTWWSRGLRDWCWAGARANSEHTPSANSSWCSGDTDSKKSLPPQGRELRFSLRRPKKKQKSLNIERRTSKKKKIRSFEVRASRRSLMTWPAARPHLFPSPSRLDWPVNLLAFWSENITTSAVHVCTCK